MLKYWMETIFFFANLACHFYFYFVNNVMLTF